MNYSVICSLHRFFLLITFCFFASLPILAHADVIVNVDIKQTEQHIAKVELQFPESTEGSVNFYLPTWRTGRYEVLNLANGVRKFTARDDEGNFLTWNKTSKDVWKISGAKNKKIIVNYQIYANQLGSRTRHIDDSHAFIDNSTVVMYSDISRSQKHIIKLNVPSAWRSVSGMDSVIISGETIPHQFIAENYDVLADSPIESGIHQFKAFSVDGRDYEIVIWGKGNYEIAKIEKDLEILVQQSKHIWENYPFKRYVFMIHATSGARGATEHLNSTIIQRSRFQFSDRKDYLGFISTAAHEFVHTWNVKQYRPKGLVPYNYQEENYDSLLWLAEGSTSYLQYQLLLRGNLITSTEFLSSLGKRITAFKHKPGREIQTVAQAGFDAWISEGGDYANNHSVNIYSEGFLTSWLLDFELLTQTDLNKSYRNVHNQLSKQFGLPKGYGEQDILTILNDLTGESYSDWWQQNVHGFRAVDFENLLAKAGLFMSYNKENKMTKESKGQGSSKEKLKTKAWTGIKTKKVANGLKINSIEKNSPAWESGFSQGDIIVAVDALRISDKDLDQRLMNFSVGQTIEMTFFRRDELMTKTIKLGKIAKNKLVIVPMEDANKQQKAFFKAWTGLEFPTKD